jgi:hypothetical protein
MFFRPKPVKAQIVGYSASEEQIEAAERFHKSLRHRYEAARQGTQDEIGAFYRSGQVMIRVSKIEVVPSIEVLALTGVDENGGHVVVAGYFKSMDVMFRKVEAANSVSRHSVEFSVRAA